jgi:hypothetical protein
VIDKRPQPDRLLVAEIYGEARHRARWRDLSSEEETAAVAELRQLADGRADLLAEGAREGEPDEPLARQAAGLCRRAGPTRRRYRPGSRRAGAAGQRPPSRRSRAA